MNSASLGFAHSLRLFIFVVFFNLGLSGLNLVKVVAEHLCLLLVILNILHHVFVFFILREDLGVLVVPCNFGKHFEIEVNLVLVQVFEESHVLDFSLLGLTADPSEVGDANVLAFDDENLFPKVLDQWIREEFVSQRNIIFSEHLGEKSPIYRMLQIRK